MTPDNSPVADATVSIQFPAESRKWTLQTTATGQFSLDRLDVGAYRLLVHRDGFFDLETTVRLEVSKILELTLAPVERLEDRKSTRLNSSHRT